MDSPPPDDPFPVVYDELRRLAAAQVGARVARADPQPNGAGPRGIPATRPRPVREPRHFFAAAAEAMRRILIDHARARLAQKRGGGRKRVPLDEAHRIAETPDGLLALDDALTRFAVEEPAKAELVKLRFFAGLSTPEAAAALGVSVATAERWWAFARTWLYADLSEAKAPRAAQRGAGAVERSLLRLRLPSPQESVRGFIGRSRMSG